MSLPDSSCGQFQEGLESKTSYILSIKIVKNVVDKFVGSCKSQTDECIFELDWIYDSTWVTIKDVKCTFDLSHFLDWDSFSDIVLCCPLFLDLFVVLSFFGLWLVSIGNSWGTSTSSSAHLTNNNKDLSRTTVLIQLNYSHILSKFNKEHIMTIYLLHIWLQSIFKLSFYYFFLRFKEFI